MNRIEHISWVGNHEDTPCAHCISSISPNIRNWSLIQGNLSINVLILNGETSFIGGWLTYWPNGVLKGEIVGLMSPISTICSVTGHRPSVPCLSWYWGVFIILTKGGRVTSMHLVRPTKKAKNLGLFHVAWHHVSATMPVTEKIESQGHHKRKPFEVKGPNSYIKWVYIPLIVLLAMSFR